MQAESKGPCARAVFLASVTVVMFASAACGTDYYVSPSGDDGNGGTSPATAWQTTTKVNSVDLTPGDRVLFEGEQTFAGGLSFTSADSGSAASAVILGSYGTGRATIQVTSASQAGLSADKAEGLEVRDLIFLGPGAAVSSGIGLHFFGNSGTMTYYRIDNVDVGGFREGGAFLPTGGASFEDIRVTHSDFHDNRLTGLTTQNWPKRDTIRDIYVGYCRFYDNLGEPGYSSHSGSGIVLGQVNGGVIERCEAFGNGSLGYGSVGIWSWDSENVTIQFCESHHNRTGGGTDGGGFDLDGAQRNSVVQYNYSHDNDGAGFMIAQWDGAQYMSNNTFRYNVSQNDGRKNSYGGILIWSGDDEPAIAVFYHNVIATSPAASGQPAAVYMMNSNHDDVVLANNVFITSGGSQLVRGSTALDKALFAGNAYFSSGDEFRIYYNGANYTSLDAFRAATGQETLAGNPMGVQANPEFLDAFAGGTIGNCDLLNTLTAYQLAWNSPMRDAGVDLAAAFGLDAGAVDFYGNPHPAGPAPDIGAFELTYSGNAAPLVRAGEDHAIESPQQSVQLDGTVSDDGLPDPPGALTIAWSVASGPGLVVFDDAAAVDTTASFSVVGEYVLRLTAGDGEFERSDEMTVTYDAVPYLVYERSDLGGGLIGWTFRIANADGLLLPYTVQMGFQGADGATIQQIAYNGSVAVHTEAMADLADGGGEPPYSKTGDTWVFSPFAKNPVPGTNPLTGQPLTGFYEAANAFAFCCFSGPGSTLGDGVELAYAVADGNVQWTGTITRDGQDHGGGGTTVLPLAGDYNDDGTVSGADYVLWANTFGFDGSPGKEDLRADGSGDGIVSGADYVIWANNFGTMAGG